MVLCKRILLPVLVVFFFSVRVVTGFGNLQQQTWVIVVKCFRFHIRDTLCSSFFEPTTDLYLFKPLLSTRVSTMGGATGVVGVVVSERLDGGMGWMDARWGGWRKGGRNRLRSSMRKNKFPRHLLAAGISPSPQPSQYHNRLSRYNSQNERSYRIFGSSREGEALI